MAYYVYILASRRDGAIYVGITNDLVAISREKELKKWKRAWKTQLIEKDNPNWNDLYESICR
ncbi:MAG TPA: hypothetical protein VNK51_08315 [Bradyrhizobium sp.]|nr:hypothetical protein [Bradyrhizobium sp.]